MTRAIKKEKTKKEPTGKAWELAPLEVLELAARLIEDHHAGLAEAKISFWLANKGLKKAGVSMDADTKLVTGINKESRDVTFDIILNAKTWETAEPKYRAYILDNQLARCSKSETGNGEPRFFIRDFTVKAFPSIIERYGLITPEIKRLDEAMHQTVLAFESPEETDDETIKAFEQLADNQADEQQAANVA